MNTLKVDYYKISVPVCPVKQMPFHALFIHHN